MSDKLIFLDTRNLKQIPNKNTKAVFIGKDNFLCRIQNESDAVLYSDVVNYLELTRLQCQIIIDNLPEVVRFADSGVVKEYNPVGGEDGKTV